MTELLEGFFQQGYLTTDLDRAVALYGERLGVKRFFTFDTSAMSPEAPIRVGLAWAGGVMVELIEPIGLAAPVYAGHLPPEGFAIRFHHMGYMIDEEAKWRDMVAALEGQGIPVALRRQGTGWIDFCYFDTRTMLGHLVEFVLAYPAGREFLAQVPRN